MSAFWIIFSAIAIATLCIVVGHWVGRGDRTDYNVDRDRQ